MTTEETPTIFEPWVEETNKLLYEDVGEALRKFGREFGEKEQDAFVLSTLFGESINHLLENRC